MPPPSQLKRNQITTVGRLLMVIVALFGSASLAQTLSDAEIEAAINRGRSTPPKVLWQELRKKETLITRGDFGKPVELRVAFLTDSDRIAIQVLYAQHELREFSVEDAKKQLGMTQVLLEAKCGNMGGTAALQNWTVQGRVHMVLKIAGKIIQPSQKQDEGFSGGWATSSVLAWFIFPKLPEDVRSVTVAVIPGAGKTKEKEVTIR